MADKQIGLLGAITPAATFLVAPLWGALADHTSRHKDVLLFTFVSSVVTRLSFSYKVRVPLLGQDRWLRRWEGSG